MSTSEERRADEDRGRVGTGRDADADTKAEADSPADADEPDIGFAIEHEELDLGERATRLCHRIARAMAAEGPAGWDRVDAVFTLTTTTETVRVFYSDEHGRSMRVQPGPDVLALVRRHRRLSAELGEGPWWRMLFTLTRPGVIEVDFDYGEEPFPDDQLLAPEVYAADLEAYPRTSLPIWLAAYIRHDGRQSRTAQTAAAQARADRAAGVRGTPTDELPALPLLWGRWAVLAATFVAIGSQRGPRILPALGFFEGGRRSGSTVYTLPGGRAVFSGGVWNAPELDAVYNRGETEPRLYRGAPEWVANPVLNPRAGNGLLTFCYWWEADSWYRGESPDLDQIAVAIPELWSAEAVVNRICRLAPNDPTDDQRAALADLIAAAENAVVTRETLAASLTGYDGFDFDIDGAYYQLVMAGVTASLPEPMPRADALTQVRAHIAAAGLDSAGYPVDDLRADRIGVGWMVYAPTAPGEIAAGRAIFYLADDGVLEQSSSSVAPSLFVTDFERRFRQRRETSALVALDVSRSEAVGSREGMAREGENVAHAPEARRGPGR